MRLLLVGAFPYPHNQGSQIYFQEQAIALRSLGAEISLLTYGEANSGGHPEAKARPAEYWRALDGFDHHRSPKWTAPTTTRAGPSWSKPLADLGLAMTLRDAIASHSGDDAFDAILTHNAEATLTALHVLDRPRPPILYCAHTLLGQELSAYLRGPKTNSFIDRHNLVDSAGRIANLLNRLGGGIDDWMARRVDGWIALTHSAERVMRQDETRPGAQIPPAVPDPMVHPGRLEPDAIARSQHLEPNGFLLYSGNLDGYQELDILCEAAAQLASRPSGHRMPLVIASHSDRSVVGWSDSMPGVEFRRVESVAEMQALLASARASLLLRRTEGGFPIKLVNSLAAGTPVIAFREREWGLEHEVNSLIGSPLRPVESLIAAIERIKGDDLLARRLALGARQLYLARHQPEPGAKQLLALIGRLTQSKARG